MIKRIQEGEWVIYTSQEGYDMIIQAFLEDFGKYVEKKENKPGKEKIKSKKFRKKK